MPHVPYTYCLRSKVTGEKYYGVRYAANCHPSELWVTYFSSSKLVKERIAKYGAENFEFEVRKTFTSVESARSWEERVLRRLHVKTNDCWLNQNVCGKYLWVGKQSREHVKKRIASSLMTKKMNPKPLPKRNPEQRKAISDRLRGIRKSPEHTANMVCHRNNKKIATCPKCQKRGQYVNMKRWHFDNCGKARKLYKCPHCGTAKALPGVMRYHFDNCKKR